jgi:hypothetical protein
MGKPVHLLATLALALLASVATLLVFPGGPAQSAANLQTGFTDSQVVRFPVTFISYRGIVSVEPRIP